MFWGVVSLYIEIHSNFMEHELHVPIIRGCNKVCGIRDQKSGIWTHSPRIREHKPWNLDQQFFEGSGTRLYCFCGIRIPAMIRNLGTKMGSAMIKHTLLRP